MGGPGYAAENKILILCSRQSMNGAQVEALVRAVEEALDWEYVLSEAKRHRVAPLLYHSLRAVRSKIPVWFFCEIERCYLANACANLKSHKDAAEVYSALGAAGIGAMGLKGIHLSDRVYRTPSLRPLSDIDVLIRKKDLPAAIKAIGSIGYKPIGNQLPMEVFLRHHFHLTFARKGGSIPLELHWKLFDDYKTPYMEELTAEVWRNAVESSFSGVRVLEMSPEDQIIYLGLHLSKHGYMNNYLAGRGLGTLAMHRITENRLIWFTDLHEVANHYGDRIDWGAVARKMRLWDVNGCFTASLRITALLFETGGEAAGLDNLNPPKTGAFERLLYGFIEKRLNGKGGSGLFIRFYEDRMIMKFERFQFRPIRLLDLDRRGLLLFITFPLETLYYLCRDKYFSTRLAQRG